MAIKKEQKIKHLKYLGPRTAEHDPVNANRKKKKGPPCLCIRYRDGEIDTTLCEKHGIGRDKKVKSIKKY